MTNEKTKEYQKKYREKNRDILTKKRKEFIKNNPDYYKNWYENNKEKCIEKNLRLYYKNHEEKKKKHREYYYSHKEEMLAKQRIRVKLKRELNPVIKKRINLKSKEWNMKNKEKKKEYLKKWRAEHKEDIKKYNEYYRNLLKKNKGAVVLEKDLKKNTFINECFTCYVRYKDGWYWVAYRDGKEVSRSVEIFKERIEAVKDLKIAMF